MLHDMRSHTQKCTEIDHRELPAEGAAGAQTRGEKELGKCEALRGLVCGESGGGGGG